MAEVQVFSILLGRQKHRICFSDYCSVVHNRHIQPVVWHLNILAVWKPVAIRNGYQKLFSLLPIYLFLY